MNSSEKLPNEVNSFIDKRKKLKLWHRLLIMASSIVVFITTYMLILPAITAEVGTLDLFDEVVSGSSIVVGTDNTTGDDILSGNMSGDDLLSGDNSDGGGSSSGGSGGSSGGGGGSSSSSKNQDPTIKDADGDLEVDQDNKLEDGVIIDVTIDKVDKEDEENENDEELSLFEQMIQAFADGGTSVSPGNYLCTFNPATGEYELDITLNFTLPQEVLKDYDGDKAIPEGAKKTYVIQYPKEIIVPEELLGQNADGSDKIFIGYQTGTNSTAFYYYFEPVTDSEGNTSYQVVMVFLDEFLDTLKTDNGDGTFTLNPVEGNVTLHGYLDKEAVQEDGSIHVEDKEQKWEFEIKPDDIEYGDNYTADKDISVKKHGQYDASTNTITYTILVASQRGTGDPIEIKDIFSDSELLKALGAELIDITYETGVVGKTWDDFAWKDEYYDYPMKSDQTTFSDPKHITKSNTDGVYYVEDENGNITIYLPGFDGEEGEYYRTWDGIVFYNADAYRITYTYKVNPDDEDILMLGNTANVTTHDEITDKNIGDSSSADVTVTPRDMIDKNGVANTQKRSITWTITVGDGNGSIDDYTLVDEMFKDVTDADIKIRYKEDPNGEFKDLPEGEYDIIHDDDGKITGIKFKNSSNRIYEVVYETELPNSDDYWDGQIVENTAELIPDDEDGPHYSDKGTGHYPGEKNCFNKNLESAEVDSNNENIYTLNWNSVFNVPESGIPADVEFIDYVEGGEDHYITAQQARDIVTALKNAWGEDSIKDIQFYTDSDSNNQWGEWISPDQITDGQRYYRFKFTTAKHIDNSKGTIEYQYSTTADISNVDENKTYSNSLSSSGISKSAQWTYSKDVVKYGVDKDNNHKTEDVNVTTSDGTVTWFVRVKIRDLINNYHIVDTLPEGVTLKELYMSKYDNNDQYQPINAGDLFNTTNLYDGAINVTYSSDGQNIILDLTVDRTNSQANDLKYIYVKYVCQIDGDEDEDKIHSLTNHVKVTIDGNQTYGEDDQTTNATWKEEEQSGGNITKDDQFDINNNHISYTIDINPDGKMYTVDGEEFSDIDFVDTLAYNSDYANGVIRDASLALTSVKLYYAKLDNNGKAIKDENGKLVKGDPVLDQDYSWTYNESVVDWGFERYTKEIKMTIPNGVPFVFEYTYVVTIKTDGNPHNDWELTAGVTNKAAIYIHGQVIEETPGNTSNEVIKDSGTSGEASGGAGYTLYKVDKDKFALTLSGAVFDLEYYDAETDQYVYVDSYTTSLAGTTGISGIPVTDTDNKVLGYNIKKSNGDDFYIPVNTLCRFRESKAPDGYKLIDTEYYFYFGESVTYTEDQCSGYYSEKTDSEAVKEAINVIIPRTEYITNEHSPDYYAAKTNLSVIKKWIDASGNDITKSKMDGSIEFELYRVFTDINGNQGEAPSTGGSGGSSIKLNWEIQGMNDTLEVFESGSSTVSPNSTVQLVIKDPDNKIKDWSSIKIYDMDTNEVIAWYDHPHTGMNGDWGTYSSLKDYGPKIDSPTTHDWDGTTFTVDIDIENVSRRIGIITSQSYLTSWQSYNGAVTIDVLGASSGVETPDPDDPNDPDNPPKPSDTVLYEHNFSDKDRNIYDGSNSTIIPEGTVFTSITGNLTDEHGDATYRINGQQTTLTRALKMESGTDIRINVKKKGILTMVFNANGNGNETNPIVNGCKINGETYSATNNVLEKELEPGEYTISRSGTCYLFYMSFEEGGELTNNNQYAHNFNDGMVSGFFNIDSAGSTANNKGTVTFEDMDISTCFKMNSKAKITFEAPGPGTIQMVITNPNNAKYVGAKINGVDHYATPTGRYDSSGNEIYLLTARVDEGINTIQRINSTEVMLYYIEYTPDDFSDDDVYTDEVPNNPNAILVGKYTITAQDDWAKVFNNLPWQVIDDNGNTLGYYSYYIRETSTGYTTTYSNNKTEGIESGTIGICNQDTDNSTSIDVVKKWKDINGNEDMLSHIDDEIKFILYATINLYEGETLNTTRTESHVFRNYISDFYNITSSSDPYNQDSYGSVRYKGETYDWCLKIESATSIKFNAPAKGKYTLVFSKKLPMDGDNLASYAGYSFNLSHNGETVKYAYDPDSKEVTEGNCTVTDTADGVVFTIDLAEAGEYELTSAGKQAYLFYMDYEYKLSDAAKGIPIGTYTIVAGDHIDDVYWAKTIDGLPLYIKDNEGNIIGEYSYYIEEIVPSSGYKTTIESTQGQDDHEANIKDGTITSGTITITNQKTETGVELPETGGIGTTKYTLTGLLLSLMAGILLLYKNKGRKKARV